MFINKASLFDFIDPITLRFNIPELESKIRELKRTRIEGFTPLKTYIVICGTFQICLNLFVAIWYLLNDNYHLFERLIICTGISIFSITLEFLTHCLQKWEFFRSFPLSIGLFFSVMYYDIEVASSPVITVTAAPLLLLVLFICASFANSWINSSLSQLIGQVIASLVIIVHFYGSENAKLSTNVIGFNIGLAFGPIVYRSMELVERNLVFLGWELDEELKNWKKLISNLPVSIFILKDENILYYNESVKNLFQLSDLSNFAELKESLKNVMEKDSSHAEGEQNLYNSLFNSTESEMKYQKECTKYFYKHDSDSEPTYLSIEITQLTLGNEACRVVVLQDLTAYEKLNEEKAIRQYQKLFFAMITHELRNPLQGVLGIFELLKSEQQKEENIKQCALGLNTGKLMMCLIQDILDLSQLEANKFTVNNAKFKPDTAVKECLEVMEHQYAKKGIDLKIQLKNEIPTIVSDKNRFKQIVFNLLGNSLKFTSKGGATVDLEYTYLKNELVTAVSDTGIGIKAEDIEKLFVPYGKMESHKAGNPQGVGFGLNICKRLSEALGGTIKVKSMYGEGTTFTFTISDKSEQIPKEDFASPPMSPIRRKKGKVLVVDDDVTCSYVITNMLKAMGYNVCNAKSGEEAINVFNQEQDDQLPDFEGRKNAIPLVFLDVNLGDMNGYQIAEALFGICDTNLVDRSFIIGISGDNSEEVKRRAKECGMKEILLKPVSRDLLKNTVEKYLL